MNLKDVILRINYFRNKANQSARDLSLMIGKHEGYINSLESTGFNIPTSVLLEIIEAFEITPEEFFAENYQNYKKDVELYDTIKALTIDKKENLMKFIKN